MFYSYETFSENATDPGQTILATCDEGYTFGDLCDELVQNGQGMIVAGEELDPDDELAKSLNGLHCRAIRVQRSDHGAGRCSVQIFDPEDNLIRDLSYDD